MQTPINTPLQEHCFYHIYNRGNDSIKVFYQPRNYDYFLQKYEQYLSGYIDTYAYCLLPNHFHLLVKIKGKEDFRLSEGGFPNSEDLKKLTAEQIYKSSPLHPSPIGAPWFPEYELQRVRLELVRQARSGWGHNFEKTGCFGLVWRKGRVC